MRYVLYNPLAHGGNIEKSLNKIIKKSKKKKIEIELISVLDIKDYNNELIEKLKLDDELEIVGGDGTLHQLIQQIDFSNIPSKIYMSRSGSGNDFARGHKGDVFEITEEIKDLPYFISKGIKHKFLNGVGIGIDASVCDEVNKNMKKESYFKTALRVFKNFKPYRLELEIDGKLVSFDDVFFFVCMNGKYIGGGMKIAPHAKRCDEVLDLYVIRAKNYRKLIRMFPLVYLGLHTILKKHVSYFKCKSVKVISTDFRTLQTDGEVLNDIDNIEIYR